MPIYEFHCKECTTEFSALRRSIEDNHIACPNCGAQRVARLLSVTARSQSEESFEPQCGPVSAGPCNRPGGCCRN